ncbi:SRPBCC domain-containing protein [Rurimicrobium arvi]|uniref:SRPBCC domain-containing protein n=1 Tax=Rurimicrobium arvi TaxID=2049916 RepID=A0ABP8MRU0_9BACT
MSDQLLIVERLLPASRGRVWRALTNKEEMKKWYFALSEFIPEPGFRFSFTGGPEDGTQYVHICEITEVVPERRLAYSWRYEGYDGISYVMFALEEQGAQTLLRLTHSGLSSFPELPDFARSNFEAGWNHIIGISLPAYLQS